MSFNTGIVNAQSWEVLTSNLSTWLFNLVLCSAPLIITNLEECCQMVKSPVQSCVCLHVFVYSHTCIYDSRYASTWKQFLLWMMEMVGTLMTSSFNLRLLGASWIKKKHYSVPGVSNRWNGIWNGTVEWKMEWNGGMQSCQPHDMQMSETYQKNEWDGGLQEWDMLMKNNIL